MKAKIFIGPQRSGKTRVADMISEFVGKEKTCFISAKECYGNGNHYQYSQITENIQLLIIDDCPLDFRYSDFSPDTDKLHGEGDLNLKVLVYKKNNRMKWVVIPQIIFTTEVLDPKWKRFDSWFNKLFDIVEFPLNGTL